MRDSRAGATRLADQATAPPHGPSVPLYTEDPCRQMEHFELRSRHRVIETLVRSPAACGILDGAVDEDPTIVRSAAWSIREDTTRVGDDTEPTADQEAPSLPRGTMIGRFVVVDQLGSGGMGVVVAAYDPELDRRVAIKLLRPSVLGDGRLRLVREAQAIARIAHPNVVSVFDVGELDGAVFIAMEHVDGQTLGKWLRQQPRTLPQILGAFRQAGRGLAAAHAADLVHRDFKPDNVLVGHDGRVRVVDFGLARGRGSAESVGAVDRLSSSNLHEALTEAGTVMGTPAYMSPEQLAGRTATAASDQFSFCVALYEALYGVRPFTGADIESLTRAVCSGVIAEPTSGRSVPGWVRRAVIKGLSTSPPARHPSMEALLRALAANPARRRRRWLVAGTAGLGAAAVAMLAYRSGASLERPPCAGVSDDIAHVWNDERAATIAAAFHATGLPYADDTWSRAAQRLDAYTGAWRDEAAAACTATHVLGTQTPELYERRRHCLGERLQRLDAFLALATTPDAATVDRAVRSVGELPDLDGCRDIEALEAGIAPPESEQVRREVARLRDEIARTDALFAAGRYREQLQALAPLLERAQGSGYLPVLAQVQHAIARGQRALDEPEGPLTLRTAFRSALAAGDDRRAIMIATDIAHDVGYEERHEAEGREWIGIAQALVQRTGATWMQLAIDNALAIIAIRAARYDEAQALFQRVVEQQRALDPDAPNLGVALLNLGSAYAERHDFEHARVYMQQAAEHDERVLGPQHPSMTSLYANLALLSLLQGHYREAEVELERTLTLQRAVLGEEHLDTARSVASMAVVQRNLGRPEAAERLHRQALAVRRAKLGPDHPEVAESMRNLAWALADQGRAAEALALAEQAQQISAQRLPPDHPEHGIHASMLAMLLLEAGRPHEALEQADQAIEILDARGHGPTASLDARRSRGAALRTLGRLEASIVALEQALTIASAHDAPDSDVAGLRFELAQSLRAAAREPERARALARQARDVLGSSTPEHQRRLAEIDAFLDDAPAAHL
jgi:tetratricopeptide (TPR) repeat protein